METLLIQVTNPKAMGMINELAELHMIRVLKKQIPTGQKLSEKYRGKLPTEIADELQEYVNQSRNDWNSRNI